MQISQPQNGGEVQLVLAEVLEVRLFENPTAGYRWRVVAAGDPVLRVEDDRFELPAEGACGTGGTHVWSFRGAQAGSATLRLEYARSWEQQSIDAFEVSVRVARASD